MENLYFMPRRSSTCNVYKDNQRLYSTNHHQSANHRPFISNQRKLNPLWREDLLKQFQDERKDEEMYWRERKSRMEENMKSNREAMELRHRKEREKLLGEIAALDDHRSHAKVDDLPLPPENPETTISPPCTLPNKPIFTLEEEPVYIDTSKVQLFNLPPSTPCPPVRNVVEEPPDHSSRINSLAPTEVLSTETNELTDTPPKSLPDKSLMTSAVLLRTVHVIQPPSNQNLPSSNTTKKHFKVNPNHRNTSSRYARNNIPSSSSGNFAFHGRPHQPPRKVTTTGMPQTELSDVSFMLPPVLYRNNCPGMQCVKNAQWRQYNPGGRWQH